MNEMDIPRVGETPAERRARFGRWAAEEPDPEYRREFLLLSMTPWERVRKSWWIYRPAAVPGLVTLIVLVLALVAWVIW